MRVNLGLRPKDAPALIRHFLTHALGGFAAVAREAKEAEAEAAPSRSIVRA
jgi:hypothetical protein